MALSAAAVSYAATAGAMLLIGLSGGLIVVPLYATLQKQASGAERGHLISTNNFLNMAAVLLSSGALWLLRDVLDIDSTRILLIAGITILGTALAALWRFPSYATSAVAWARSVFNRIEPAGREPRAVMRTAAAIIVLLALVPPPAAAQEGRQTLAFGVRHQLFGDIGTVNIDIRREGVETHVKTSIDIRATVLGVTIRRITGECREVWRDGQLLRFASAITTNGKARAVRADFDGSRLVVETAEGRTYAPPDTQPENPWSLSFTRASTVMSPESGELSTVEVADLGYESLDPPIDRTLVRHYRIRGETEQHLYFDPGGAPVKLIHAHSTGKVTLVRIDSKSGTATPRATASLRSKD
jgi:hypothetical protein